jgi:2-methylcitrate dehydratase PrpD
VSHSEELAEFACSLGFDDLPEEVIRRAKDVILDTLGAAIYGSGKAWSRALIELAEEASGKAEASIWGTSIRVPAVVAGLVNGTASHGFELDDYHAGAKLHPGAVVIPAAIAVAERLGASGRQLIAAVVAGYEVAIRTSLASVTSTWARGFHPTGVFGGFGAAAASGNLMGLGTIHMQNALGLAASQASGLLMAAVAEGAMSKRLHAGKAASNGVFSALLASKGFTAPTRVFEVPEGSFYKAYSDHWDLGCLTDGLGERFMILDTSFKRYACCGSIHSSIDCLLDLRDEHQIAPEAVERIVVRNSRIVLEQNGWDYRPSTQFAAQMSLQYCLAVALLEGHVSVAQFREELLADPKVLDLAGRVRFEVDPDIDGVYPMRFPGFVEVCLRDGRVFSRRTDAPRGSPQNPMSRLDLQAKFRVLAGTYLGEDVTEAIIRTVDKLEELQDIRYLTVLLGPRCR